MEIEKRYLGKTDIRVTPVGLGVMQFSGGGGLVGYGFPILPQEQKNAIVQAALDGGINWFDTAELYGRGASERSLATALQAASKQNGEVVVATKWLPLLRTAGNIPKSIKSRLYYLDGYPIDLYMVHFPYSFSSRRAEMKQLAKLVKDGQIRSIGVSNFSARQMRQAQTALNEYGLSLAANQVEYSLVNRKIESNGILETALELGVSIIAYTPLGYGLLTGKYQKNPELLENMFFYRRRTMKSKLETTRPLLAAMEEIASGHNATPGQVALNWLFHAHGELVVTIPGASKVRQVQENAGAMRFHLTEDEIARLAELSNFSR